MEHPFADLVGMTLESCKDGQSVYSLTVTDTLLNPHRVLHGGVLYSLADTGMGAALYHLLEPGQLCATIEIKINYFAPVFEGRLTCQSRVLNRGKTVANLESELWLDERVVARANGNFAIFRLRENG